MKHLLYFIILCITLFSCDNAYPKEKKNYDMLIFEKDTITIIGAQTMDFSRIHNLIIHGYNDTTTGIIYITIEPKQPDNSIEINNHKGDIITDHSIKNVYNK